MITYLQDGDTCAQSAEKDGLVFRRSRSWRSSDALFPSPILLLTSKPPRITS